MDLRKWTLGVALCALVSAHAVQAEETVADTPPMDAAAAETASTPDAIEEAEATPALSDGMAVANPAEGAVPMSSAETAEAPAADAMLADATGELETAPAAPAPEDAARIEATPVADAPSDAVETAEAEPAAAPAAPAPDAAAWTETTPVADVPAEPVETAEAEPAAEPSDPAGTYPPLGAIGYDSEGRQGRIHIVATADTLWDISEAYLGTPWVWPSIWRDNEDIPNPHVIHPGDRIWITPSVMRRVTAEQADAMLAGSPGTAEEPPAAALQDGGEEPVLEAEIATAVEPAPVLEILERGSFRVSTREAAGLIAPEQLASSGSIVGKVPERVLLSQEDEVYIGLGESEVEAGDELTVFRTNEKVFDPDTGALLGYHVQFLGHVRVEETFPETSLASIRMSTSDVEVGDRLLTREPLPHEISIQPPPDNVEGKISFFPDKRVLMGLADYVFLNRGTLDGVEVGSPLEVFRAGYPAIEISRNDRVDVPDRVIAQMLVVRAETDSSVAVVTAADGELELGDRFRGAGE